MVISEPAKENLGRNKARFNRDNKGVSGPITILGIDDDPEFRELTKTGLKRENEAFEVIMESNPREVDSLLDQHAVDCLVTDYEMPHINGIELVKRVHDQYPALPVILYTGKGSEEIASRAISAGVTDYVKKDGTINEYELLANRISNAVEKRRQEQHAAGLRQRFEVVLETMDTAVFLKEPNGQYLLMNDACRELLGVNPEQDVTELTDEDLFPPERIDKYQADDRRVAETGKQIETEEMVPGTTGEQIRLTRKSPVYDQDGSVTAICGVSTDITEQKEREQEIRKLKKRLELAVEGANLGVWDWDMVTDTFTLNDNMVTMCGYDPEEIDPTLEEWEQRVHPADMPAVEEALEEHIAGDTELYDKEYRVKTADGNWKWIRDVGRIFERNEAGEPIRAVGIHIDIDERKRNEQLLREQREMFTQGPAILFKWENADGWPVEFVSENIEETLGYKPEQFYSGELQYTDIVHDDDMQQVADETADAIESNVGYFRQKPYRLITADGESRWVLEYTKNVQEDSEITHHQGYIVDVTERVSKEQQLQQQRDNLEVLNQVVRHDIRNDLQLVLAYANMLESHVAPDGSEHIEQVVKSTQDAIDITNTAKELTDIMLQKDPSLSPVQLPAVLSERLMAVRSSNEDAEINLNGSIPDVKVLADEMLESVFRNLLKNAILHNDTQTPKINVSARCTEETVAVHIADNGPGIPDSQKEMIFEEGETTLDSDGTGLGLYLVETLIDRYGGTVKLTDNDPEGSVFTVELKRA